MIAVDDKEIGVDVERCPEETRLKVAERFYHPAELAYVRKAAQPRAAFCEIWTRKEAYLKMTGEGISIDLTAFDTTSAPLSEQLITRRIDGYCLSVCSQRPITEEAAHISKIELKDIITTPQD